MLKPDLSLALQYLFVKKHYSYTYLRGNRSDLALKQHHLDISGDISGDLNSQIKIEK